VPDCRCTRGNGSEIACRGIVAPCPFKLVDPFVELTEITQRLGGSQQAFQGMLKLLRGVVVTILGQIEPTEIVACPSIDWFGGGFKRQPKTSSCAGLVNRKAQSGRPSFRQALTFYRMSWHVLSRTSGRDWRFSGLVANMIRIFGKLRPAERKLLAASWNLGYLRWVVEL
jgi:hypothetical protein